VAARSPNPAADRAAAADRSRRRDRTGGRWPEPPSGLHDPAAAERRGGQTAEPTSEITEWNGWETHVPQC
jgi:hypothetical protein